MRLIYFVVLLLSMTFSTTTAQERFLVANQNLEVRSGPKATFNTIAEVSQGTPVYVLSSAYGEWSAVQYKNINGFVKTKLLVKDNRKQEADAAAAKAAQVKARETAKQRAAEIVAQKTIEEAERVARETIAAAELLKRETEARAAEAIAKAEIIKKNKSLAANRAAKETQTTLAAVKEAQRRAAASGEDTAIVSTTPSYGASTTKINNHNTTSRKIKVSQIIKKDTETYKDWNKKSYKSGATPKSFNFKGKFNYKLDNYLKIEVGNNTDVIVKLYRMGKTEKEDQCIRITYIKRNTSHDIKHIPEGWYYLKIAYGKDWRETVKDGKHYGTFTKNALYQKGGSTLNFHTVKTDKKNNFPSYKLSLNILDDDSKEQDIISNEEFNDFL